MLSQRILAVGLPVMSAIALALCFTEPACVPLAWGALTPLAIAVRVVRSAPLLYLGASLGGALMHLAALDWVRTSYGAQGLSGDKALVWLVMGLGLAPLFPLAMWLLRRPAIAGLPMLIGLPLAWTIAEAFRWHYPRLVTGTPFPWLQLGAIPVEHAALAQNAEWGGIWAITALVALVNGALADLCLRARTWRATLCAVAIPCLVLFAAHEFGRWRLGQTLTGKGPRVCLMPTSSADRLLSSQPVSSLDDRGLQHHADLLLWSETALEQALTAPRASAETATLFDHLANYATHCCTPVVVGCRRIDGAARFNSLAIVHFDQLGDPAFDWYDKAALVPWSESCPRWLQPFVTESSGRYDFGQRCSCFALTLADGDRPVWVAPLICYDTCFAGIVARYFDGSRPAPDLLVVASCETSDRTGVAANTMLRMARWRATEFRRPIVRNAEGGISALIDSRGQVLVSQTDLDAAGPTVLPSAPLDARVTLYATLGDWFPLVCVAVWLALEAAARVDYAKSRSSNKISATNSATVL